MGQPFTCPFCGAHNYTIVLTGCDIGGATLEEEFAWDADSGEYGSGGAVLLDSQSIENERGQAICSACEKDVSEAMLKYEQQNPGGNA
jgi:hypothetical protein